jgi:hypothetical protein
LIAGALWTISSLETFIEVMIQEQDKFIKIGVIKKSKVHALVAHDGNNSQHKKYKKREGEYKTK